MNRVRAIAQNKRDTCWGGRGMEGKRHPQTPFQPQKRFDLKANINSLYPAPEIALDIANVSPGTRYACISNPR